MLKPDCGPEIRGMRFTSPLLATKALNVIFIRTINNIHKGVKMSARTLSLSEEVYARLDAEREEGERFNGVITRLTDKKTLTNIVGFLKEEGAEEMWQVIEAMREKSRGRMLRLTEE